LLRELHEMRYLWMRPIRLDTARLLELLGGEPHTPIEQAVEASLIGIGCLPDPKTHRSMPTQPLARS
jgi:hypothetical protein